MSHFFTFGWIEEVQIYRVFRKQSLPMQNFVGWGLTNIFYLDVPHWSPLWVFNRSSCVSLGSDSRVRIGNVHYSSHFWDHISPQLAVARAGHNPQGKKQSDELESSRNASEEGDPVCTSPTFACCMFAVLCVLGGFSCAALGIVIFNSRTLRNFLVLFGMAVGLFGFTLPGLPPRSPLWQITWGHYGCNSGEYRYPLQHRNTLTLETLLQSILYPSRCERENNSWPRIGGKDAWFKSARPINRRVIWDSSHSLLERYCPRKITGSPKTSHSLSARASAWWGVA